jgi:Type I restriction enzyme R protein N terminus (HSDR_N)
VTSLLDSLHKIVALQNENRPEDYVREELVLPVLRSLGYESNSVSPIDRGVRLARHLGVGQVEHHREHLLPDLVLRVLGTAVWVVEVKSTKVRLGSPDQLRQVEAYARNPGLACSHVLLTNGVRYIAYKATRNGTGLHRLGSFDVRALVSRASLRRRFDRLTSPSGAYLRACRVDDVIEIYRDGDWPTRLVCMDAFMRLSRDEARRLVPFVPSWHRSGSTRERNLPALCLLRHGEQGSGLADWALADSHDAVRDTFYTVVRRAVADQYRVDFALEDSVPSGWFSRVLYLQMLAAAIRSPNGLSRSQRTVADQQVRRLGREPDSDVRFFASLAERCVVTPFPFRIFLGPQQFPLQQSEIGKQMLHVTLRQVADPEYEVSSRQNALDAICAAQVYHPASIQLALSQLAKRDRSKLHDLLSMRDIERV